MTIGYSPDALIYDPDEETWSLRPDYDPAIHRLDFVWDDNGATLDGDTPADEVGYDRDQNVLIRTMDGTPIAKGQVYDEEYVGLTIDGAGPVIDLERLEIGGQLVGYVVSAPLQTGVIYDATYYDDVNAGNALQYSQLADVPCFGPGTMIATADGTLPIDWLARGDRVITRDGGTQVLRWIGRYTLSARQLAERPALRPVQVGADGLGRPAPERPLLVSPQQRVLLQGGDIALHFGVDEALAAAQHIAPPAPHGVSLAGFTYYHLLFDAHQIVCANGIWCESLFAARRPAVAPGVRAEGLPAVIRHRTTARPCLTTDEAQLIASLRGTAKAGAISRAA
ncbi:MAG: Hint domain-containing protein [Rhodobacter sp.]|nr:Hint domain-containing protein [Rhodobacter sp.]